MEKEPFLSIILIVKDEGKIITSALKKLIELGADEIIVSDGNSRDATPDIVKRNFPEIELITNSFSNRALQINSASKKANGKFLLFVHADTALPRNTKELIQGVEKNQGIGGAFQKTYSNAGFVMKIYCELTNLIVTRLLKYTVGTNAQFVRKDVFKSMSGFSSCDFLEDLEFSRRLKRLGKIVIVKEKVVVSPRRYQNQGVLRQIAINAKIMAAYCLFGVSPLKLKKWYAQKSEK